MAPIPAMPRECGLGLWAVRCGHHKWVPHSHRER